MIFSKKVTWFIFQEIRIDICHIPNLIFELFSYVILFGICPNEKKILKTFEVERLLYIGTMIFEKYLKYLKSDNGLEFFTHDFIKMHIYPLLVSFRDPELELMYKFNSWVMTHDALSQIISNNSFFIFFTFFIRKIFDENMRLFLNIGK
jgi:hypothetical protein